MADNYYDDATVFGWELDGAGWNVMSTNIDVAYDLVNALTATTTELNYVDGVTSAIQTQLDAKAPIANPTFTGEVGIGSVNVSETELGILEGATLTTTELNYVGGVTSAIQTQIGTKITRSGLSKISVGTTTPATPSTGDLWVDTN